MAETVHDRLAIAHDDLAAQQHKFWCTDDLEPFVGKMVDRRMMRRRADRDGLLRVEDYEISIASDGYPTLGGQTEDLCRVLRRHFR